MAYLCINSLVLFKLLGAPYIQVSKLAVIKKLPHVCRKTDFKTSSSILENSVSVISSSESLSGHGIKNPTLPNSSLHVKKMCLVFDILFTALVKTIACQ